MPKKSRKDQDEVAKASGRKARTKAATHSSDRIPYTDVLQLLPPSLDEEQLRDIVQRLPIKHRNHKEQVLQQQRQKFARWRLQLRQGFSLLFYGLGSKRSLLHTFAAEALTDGGVLAFNGWQPAVTAKMVLGVVAQALTFQPSKGRSCAELLEAMAAEPGARQVYVLLHNIDGPGLRSPEDQAWLAQLAALPAVHLVASLDHTHGGLLWDGRGAAAFRWLWVEAATYGPYTAETLGVAPVLARLKQTSAQRGAGVLLAGLVPSARGVFRVMGEWQLEEGAGAAGISFPQLFRLVRERFILNTEAALRAQLTEFRDHELVKVRPGGDGGEVMYIPLAPDNLRAALEQLEAGEQQPGAAGAGAAAAGVGR